MIISGKNLIKDFSQKQGRPDLLVIAGEHSGDQHAAKLVQELKLKYPHLDICALGGPELKSSGTNLLMDLTAYSVLGIWEAIRRFPFFYTLLEDLVKWIEIRRPKHILLVDYPGFNLTLAKTLHKKKLTKKSGGDIGMHFYISPQIWAWKGKRRFKMAEMLDDLAVIFPFEVNSYSDTTLPVSFVGHPFIEQDVGLELSYNPKSFILLLPGSRKIAVSYIFPKMLNAMELFFKVNGPEKMLVIYPTDLIRTTLEKILSKYPHLQPYVTLSKHTEKIEAKAVLTSSGTMSLKCSLAGIPGAIVYAVNPISYAVGTRLLRIKYLGIANILLNEDMYPEFWQHKARPDTLCKELIECIEGKERIAYTQDAAKRLKSILTPQSVGHLDASDWLAQAMGINTL